MPGNLALTVAGAIATILGSLALAPLFADSEWFLPAAAGVVVVAATGGTARALRVPLVVHPLLQGAALALLLTALYAGSAASWGFLPGGDALAVLRETIQAGTDDINRFAPPVPTSTGVVAVTVLGVGLAALLVDVLAVPLRAAALAGVPLLAMYVVPAAVLRNGAPWWAFVPGAVGWLVLLTIDSRETLVDWGAVLDRVRRPAAPIDADDPTSSSAGGPRRAHAATVASGRRPGIGGAARRLGLVAVAFAVVLPLLLPSLAEPVFRRGSGSGDGAGSADEGVTGTLSLNPFVSLKRDYFEAPDRIVVSYRTDAPVPDYLRTVTMNRFTGTTWEPDEFEVRNDRQVNGGLPPQVDFLSEQASLPVRGYRIRIGALEGRYLPTPYPPLTVTIGTGWFYDPATRTVFSDGAGITGARYTATAVEVAATPDRLRKAPPIVSPAVGSSLDRANIPRSVELLARQVVGDAPTAYDQAVALQDWFRSEFQYSTTVRSGNDAGYLEQFLRERVGYCEQFAATMALMARTLGIPARVAIGFAQGERDGDSWNLTLRDAHAWPELWFAGTGWIRFEPTPQGEGGGVSVPAYATVATSPTGDGTSTPGIAAPGGAGLQAERIRERELARDAATDEILDVGGTGDTLNPADDEPWRRPLVLGLLGVLLAGAAVPLLVRAWRRRQRFADQDPRRLAEGAWAELRDTCIDLDLPWSDAASPRAAAATLRARVALDPAADAALAHLVGATEASRYARPPGPTGSARPPVSGATLRSELRSVRHALEAGVGGSRRWQSRLWPASARPWHDSPSPVAGGVA